MFTSQHIRAKWPTNAGCYRIAPVPRIRLGKMDSPNRGEKSHPVIGKLQPLAAIVSYCGDAGCEYAAYMAANLHWHTKEKRMQMTNDAGYYLAEKVSVRLINSLMALKRQLLEEARKELPVIATAASAAPEPSPAIPISIGYETEAPALRPAG